jgi:hypothetical protein
VCVLFNVVPQLLVESGTVSGTGSLVASVPMDVG